MLSVDPATPIIATRQDRQADETGETSGANMMVCASGPTGPYELEEPQAATRDAAVRPAARWITRRRKREGGSGGFSTMVFSGPP
jgi:hypothetical protein